MQVYLSVLCMSLHREKISKDKQGFIGITYIPKVLLALHTRHYIPRNVSVRPQQVSHCVRTFNAVLRNNLYRFFIRCTSSANLFIRSLQMSDAFYKSSFFLNYSTLLYGDQMQ